MRWDLSRGYMSNKAKNPNPYAKSAKDKAKAAKNKKVNDSAKENLRGQSGLTDMSGVDGYFRPEHGVNRWSLGTQLIMGNFLQTIGLNFLMLLFFAPVLYLILSRAYTIMQSAKGSPFTSNMGIGYFPITNMVGLEESILYNANFTTFIWMPLAAIWLSVGLSGGLYLMRNLAWGENVTVIKGFISGVKKNFVPMLIETLLYSLVLSASVIMISYLNRDMAVNGTVWYLTLSKIALYVLIVLATLHFMSMISLIVTYKGSFFALFKNAMVLSTVLSPLNAIFAAFSLLPFIMLFFSGTMTFGVMLILMFGATFFLVVWTLYNQWVYEKFLDQRVERYKASREEEEQHENRKKAATNASAQNGYVAVGTKQSGLAGVKAVTDYEVGLTAIEGAFTRDSLVKAEQEKQQF